MLHWIHKVLHKARGHVGRQVHHLIYTLVHGAIGHIIAIFNQTRKGWRYLARRTYDFEHHLWHLGQEIDDALHYAICVLARDMAHWIIREIVYAWTGLRVLAKDTRRLDDYLKHLIHSLIDDVRDWALRHIWDPLWAWVQQLIAWAKDWAFTAWYYITHPEKLAALLFWYLIAYLERHIVDVIERVGEWALRWFIAHLMLVLHLVETTITRIV